MNKLLWQEMTTLEIEDAVSKGHDIALLPLGSVEMHGPHVPTGCDTYIAPALCVLVAHKAGGLVLPPVHYSWPGATRKFMGTIRITHEETVRYVNAIVSSLVDHGFRKILLVSAHGGYRWLGPAFAREFFERTGVPVIFMETGIFAGDPDLRDIFEGKDGAYREASLLLGALDILGKGAVLDLTNVNDDAVVKGVSAVARVRRYGIVGFDCRTIEQHIAPRKNVSREKGAKYLRLLAEKFQDLSSDLDAYLEFLSGE